MMECVKRPKSAMTHINVRQYYCLVVVGLTTFGIGLTKGWTAVLPKLQEDHSKFTITEDDVSWLVSLVSVVGIFSSLVSGMLMECLGPRRLLLVALLPSVFFWIMKAFTPYLFLLYIGRICLAVIAAIISTAGQPLEAELSSPENRGLACVLPEIAGAIGLLVGYLFAHLMTWDMATLASAFPTIPVCLLLFAVPESPYWLVRKKKTEAAKKALRHLMGPNVNVDKEIEAISSTATSTASTKKTTVKDQLEELRKPTNAKPVVLLFMIFILRELGGKSAIFSYTVYVFLFAGVDFDPFTCTVLVGVVRLVCTIISASSLDLAGRRPLLLGTTVICAVSQAVAGVWLLLDIKGSSWVPLCAVLFYVGAYGIGLGSIPWVYIGELLPTPVRCIGASIINFGYSSAIFILEYVFLKVTALIGIGTTLVVFANINAVLVFIIWRWIPETRGRTLQDLDRAFMAKNPKKSTCSTAIQEKEENLTQEMATKDSETENLLFSTVKLETEVQPTANSKAQNEKYVINEDEPSASSSAVNISTSNIIASVGSSSSLKSNCESRFTEET